MLSKNCFKFSLLSLGLTLLSPKLLAQSSQQRPSYIQGPFFNHQESQSYTDPYRGIYRPGSDLEAHLLSAIESAQKTIDVAVQEIRLPLIARALVRKHRAGVRVRIVLENQYNFSISELNEDSTSSERGYAGDRLKEYLRYVDMNGDGTLSPYEISQRDAIAILRSGGVPIIDDTADGSLGSALMHHKFIVVDAKHLVLTSANFTMSDIHGDYSSQVSRGNANALLKFEHPSIVENFQREFDILWGSPETQNHSKSSRPRFGMSKPYRGAQRISLSPNSVVSIQFSPTPRHLGFEASTSGLIDRTLKRSQSSVNLALFVFSEQRFADTLDDLRRRFPLKIQVLVEPTFAFQWYSELLDILGLKLYGPNCLEDQGNRVWSPPLDTVGVPTLAKGDFLHHKFAVIDSRITIFGSQNWSSAANSSNDENLLVIEDAAVAQRFEEEFARLQRNAHLGASESLLRKVEEMRQSCEN
jgi:phosphatidylserine/phosphatidylglycerophosphate/cardiolipin synthase-like enzyme